MSPRFLLDTHILVWWLTEPRKLSSEQSRVLREAIRRHEPVAISAITLLELALLLTVGSTRTAIPPEDLFEQLEAHPAIQILPLTISVASEVAAIGSSLRDPADRTIVATARSRKLRLITADQRIIESNLVPVVT